MLIKWLAHASFLITSGDGKKIVTDPYHVGPGISHKPIQESADLVTISHGHADHTNAAAIKGNPTVLKAAGSWNIQGIEVKTVSAFHDDTGGQQRGQDLIFCFKLDDLKLCHVGDLGHPLNQQQIAQIGDVDILFIPVGGYFTMDVATVDTVIASLHPKLVFPMHYKTSKIDLPITGVEDFLKGKKNVRRINSSEFEVKKETLPKELEIVVLQPAY